MKGMSIEDLLEHYVDVLLKRAEDVDLEINNDDALLFAWMVSAQALDNISGRMNQLYFLFKQELEHTDECN